MTAREQISVSIAVATYNGERYLDAFLRSVTEQTRPPDEVVISDDGSSDRTVAICRQWATSQTFRVSLIEGDHLGFGANFSRALTATSGDVVFFADQDDVWDPSKVRRVLNALNANPAASLFIHDLRLVSANLEPSGETMLERLAKMGIGPSGHVKGCCTAITRALADLAIPIPEGIAHDVFVHHLAPHVGPAVLLREPLISYRIHDGNTSGWAPNSLVPVTKWWMFRLRLRALTRRLTRRVSQASPVTTAVADRLAQRGPGSVARD